MSKFWAIFRISWENSLVYRLNFILWRFRTILQLLLIYFIWWTVFESSNGSEIFGYTKASILTYVMVAALLRAIILSSRAMDVGNQINDGSIVNFLVKPLNFIKYYLTRDLADKTLNTAFAIFEVTIFILILKPEIISQTDIFILFLTILAAIFAVIIYFCISLIVSMLAFWVESSWAFLFLMTIFLEGFGGGLFPIDILPKNIFNMLMLTPFPYLIYFPSKLYLGGLSNNEILFGFSIIFFWVIILWILMRWVLQMGLKAYTAFGN